VEAKELEQNVKSLLCAVQTVVSHRELDQIKSDILGKSGYVTRALKSLRELPDEEKKAYGAEINKIKNHAEEIIAAKIAEFEERLIEEKLKNEKVDITLPVESPRFGGLHLITNAIRRIRDYYLARGFLVLDGPEIETDFYNFDALNIHKYHPARQSHDTFYLKGFEETLLRTQTSCVQIRTMMEMGVPVRMVSIGKTYRNDALDATHSPMFHQLECLVVDEQPVNIGHLKNELRKSLSFFFDVENVALRFRPSFFPFTEPSLEVDCRYTQKDGRIIITEDGDRWIEIAGAGIVHPNVFKNCGIQGQQYGFAFAFGLDRLVMMKNGIQDIRNLFDTDSRWLKHYGQ
jgi:phenylalanyl-tRNA synthetase alpha chain